MLTHNETGQEPAVEYRRGMAGVMLDGLWTPLPIKGGDGTDDGDDGKKDDPAKPEDKAQDKDDGEPFDKDRAMATIQRLRQDLKDAKAGGKKAEELQAKLDEIEKGQLSEKDRLERERDEYKGKLDQAEQKSRDRVIRSEVRVIASELGFADPSDAHRFLDVSGIEFDDDGEPKGIKKLLEDLAKAKPYLIKSTGNGTSGVPGSPRPTGQSNHQELVTQTKDELKKSGRYSF